MGAVREVRTRDAERTRTAILQGALEEFAAVGYEGASNRAIAQRAGATHGLIRYYYDSKEKLWLAAAEFLFSRLDESLSAYELDLDALKTGDRSSFQNWLRRYVYYCAHHPEHARFMMQVSTNRSERLSAIIDQFVVTSHRSAIMMIERLIDNGVFPKGTEPVSILYIIAGACQNIFALSNEAELALGYNPLSEDAIISHAEAIIAFFCPNQSAPSE